MPNDGEVHARVVFGPNERIVPEIALLDNCPEIQQLLQCPTSDDVDTIQVILTAAEGHESCWDMVGSTEQLLQIVWRWKSKRHAMGNHNQVQITAYAFV